MRCFRVGLGGLWEGMLATVKATVDEFPLFKYCSVVLVPEFFECGLIHLQDGNQFPEDILKHFFYCPLLYPPYLIFPSPLSGCGINIF